jgi:glycosyltransferase involved in cell wall biosynthesis
MTNPLPGPIAYITGEYPRATDTFIQREIAALRRRGIEGETCSIRRTGAEHHVGPEQQSEYANTFYVIAAAKNPLTLIGAHLAALICSPGGYFSALGLALRTAPPGLRAFLWQLFYFAEAGVLARHLRARGVVHLHNHIATASCTVAMLAARLGGFPYSFTIHGPGIFFEPEHWRIDAKIAEASFTICISDFCRSQCMMFSKAEDWDRLHIVHCGIDPAKYGQRPPREDRTPHMVFIGRLAGVKGVPVLFDALERLKDRAGGVRVTMVGDGPERAALEADARARGLAELITFTGYLSQDAVAGVLDEADLLVLPSFAEGVPVTLMEAMAARLPVVTTLVGGIPELVEDGVSGYLVPPGNPDILADRLETLLADPDLRARMGEAGREKVTADFEVDREAGRIETLLSAYLGSANPPNRRPEPAQDH